MSNNNNNNITIINKYRVFDMLDQYLVENIKIFYIPNANELFYVTKDDQVFKYHTNKFIKTKYDELCSKHVIKLASSFEHYMALTNTGSVYSWGSNKFGELGDGSNVNCDKPKLIDALCNEFIIDICCGHMHSLVLSDKGVVYAFGFNSFGEIGNFRTEHQLTPFKVNIFRASKVKSISCGLHHSTVLTEDGRVSVWGSNSWGQLGTGSSNMQIIPTELNMPLIKQVVCDSYGSILLTVEGDIYFCGLGSQSFRYKKPIKVNKNIKFIEIAASIHCSLCVAVSVNNKCYIFSESKLNLNETIFASIDETYATLSKPQITYKSYVIPYIKEDIKFIEKFEVLKLMGCGGFGSVFKVKDRKNENNFFAVKKVHLKNTSLKSVTNEVNFLSNLTSSFTVKYIDSWIEENYYIGSFDSDQSSSSSNSLSSSNNIFNPHFTKLLHIQMELCPMSLKDAIVNLKQYFLNSNTNNCLSVCYYIISELFVEIVECVQYLHHQNPPIIHRDLKPDNILLTNFVNHRFVKLADFGLSTFHEADNQSHTKYVGTKSYRAPEVSFNKTYTNKADIYSLGMIFTELYQIIESELKYKKIDSLLNAKANKGANNLINKLIQTQDQRPNCDKILCDKHQWSFSNEDIIKNKEFLNILSKSHKANSISDDFVEFFIQNKYSYNQSRNQSKNSFMNKLFVNRARSE